MSTEAQNSKERKTFLKQPFGKGADSGSIECKVDVIMYEEEDIHYVYTPALDLMGYGKTADEALRSWEVVLEEYLAYTSNKNTLVKDLENHGWKIKKSLNQFQPPAFSWLLQNNEQLSEMYNNRDFLKTSRVITVPSQNAFA